MIKGLAKMEFGSGDIRMTAALSNGVGALCCLTQEPHGIGERVPVSDDWSTNEAEVILTFTKVESIDALIDSLKEVRDIMDGTYKIEEKDLKHGPFDFDAFMNKIDDKNCRRLYSSSQLYGRR